ncbi:hypothetical protein RFI_11478, partial [Reticulomyxa filosa]
MSRVHDLLYVREETFLSALCVLCLFVIYTTSVAVSFQNLYILDHATTFVIAIGIRSCVYYLLVLIGTTWVLYQQKVTNHSSMRSRSQTLRRRRRTGDDERESNSVKTRRFGWSLTTVETSFPGSCPRQETQHQQGVHDSDMSIADLTVKIETTVINSMQLTPNDNTNNNDRNTVTTTDSNNNKSCDGICNNPSNLAPTKANERTSVTEVQQREGGQKNEPGLRSQDNVASKKNKFHLDFGRHEMDWTNQYSMFDLISDKNGEFVLFMRMLAIESKYLLAL